MSKEDDNVIEKWRQHVNKRIKRLENLFCIQAILFVIAFISFRNFEYLYDSYLLSTFHQKIGTDNPIIFQANDKNKEIKVSTRKYDSKNLNRSPRPQLIQRKPQYESYRSNEMKKKPFVNSALPSNDFTYDRLSDVDMSISRNLNSPEGTRFLTFEEEHAHCDSLPILSPVSDISNFTLDERAHSILHMIYALSSAEALDDHDSPQYQSACWILFDDKLQISPGNHLMIQRYVMAVIIHALRSDVRGPPLPLNTCDHPIVKCNDEEQIIGIIPSE